MRGAWDCGSGCEMEPRFGASGGLWEGASWEAGLWGCGFGQVGRGVVGLAQEGLWELRGSRGRDRESRVCLAGIAP